MRKIEVGFPKPAVVIISVVLGCASPKTPNVEAPAPGTKPVVQAPQVETVAPASPPEPAATGSTESPAAPPDEAIVPIVLPPAKLVQVLHHPGTITSLSFDPTSAAFVSGCTDRRIRLWSAEKGRLARTFADHSDAVSSVAFRFDGAEILSGSLDGTAKSWNPKTGRRFATTAGQKGGVTSVAYSADGRWLALGSLSGPIALVDPADEGKRFDLAGHTAAVRSLVFAQKHEWLASRADDGVLALWNVAQRKMVQRISLPKTPASAVSFASEDAYVVTAWAKNGAAALGVWEAQSGKHVRDVDIGGSTLPAVALSADGRLIAVGTYDGVLQLWDFKAGQKLQELKRLRKGVLAISFSADSKYLVAGGDDRAVAIWQLYEEPTEPPGRTACLERCHKRNMYTDCADQEGGMVPCPCRCP